MTVDNGFCSNLMNFFHKLFSEEGNMRFSNILILGCFLFISFLHCDKFKKQKIEVFNLLCEYQTNPLGIDIEYPRLSWSIGSNLRGQEQTAYHILVASGPNILSEQSADLWDSG